MAQEKRPFFKYTEESLNRALKVIRENNTSVREASRLFGVPRATLQDRIKGRVKEGPRQMGRDPVLGKNEEKKIVKWVLDLSRCGFPQRKSDLLDTVEKIVTDDKRPTPFTNNRPGEKWYKCFLKRHPELSLRESEGLTKGRAIVTEQYIRKWFSDLKSYLEETNNLDIMSDPERILNGDESGFNLCPKSGKVLGPKGARNILEIKRGNDKENITTLLVFTASGKTATPCVVFKYVRIPKAILDSSDPSWHITKSESGWMKSHVFFEYVSTQLLPWLQSHNIKFPIIFFVDGHKSHLTMELSQFCEEHDIILYSLPPNTTHMMQPADVGVFKPLKTEWKKVIHQWLRNPENIHSAVTITTFCPLLKAILQKPTLSQNIINGFKKCGLYPFNPEAVDYTKCVQNHLETVVTENEHENRITDEEIGIAQNVLTNFENRLQDERFGIINVLVYKLESFKASPNLNREKIEDWSTIEDLPIIFVGDSDSPSILNDGSELIDVEYLTDEKEVQNIMKEIYDSGVREHDNNNKHDNQLATMDDSVTTGSKETKDNGINALVFQSEKTEADQVSVTCDEAESLIETKVNLTDALSELHKETENSRTNKSDELTISYERKSEQSAEGATDEVDIEALISTERKHIKLQEESSNDRNDYENVPPDIRKPESDIVIQLTRLEIPKINILQDVTVKSNLEKHLVYPTPITSRQRRNADPQPAAISSPKYREYLDNKAIKTNTGNKKKVNNENKIKRKKKRSNVNINNKSHKCKEHCWRCKEDLNSDEDEGDAEHVNCENCPRWYHLKCSGLSARSLFELKEEYFKCNSC